MKFVAMSFFVMGKSTVMMNACSFSEVITDGFQLNFIPRLSVIHIQSDLKSPRPKSPLGEKRKRTLQLLTSCLLKSLLTLFSVLYFSPNHISTQ